MYWSEKSWKLPITSFILRAWRGGNKSWTHWAKKIIAPSWIFENKSRIKEKLCEMRYTISPTTIVIIWLIKVENKNTIARSISNFKKVKNKAQDIRFVIAISENSNTPRNTSDWTRIIKAIVPENPKNFPRIKSCLFIGFESMRKIVFHSTSLNNSWLPTKSTPISPNISIIPSPKSTITFSDSPIVSFPRARENIINTKAKKRIRYKNLFLTISLKVFLAMFSINGNLNSSYLQIV